jgi:hypothetical protein
VGSSFDGISPDFQSGGTSMSFGSVASSPSAAQK